MSYYFIYFERFIYSESQGSFFVLFFKENHFILSSKQNPIYNIIKKSSINFFTVSPKNKTSDLDFTFNLKYSEIHPCQLWNFNLV